MVCARPRRKKREGGGVGGEAEWGDGVLPTTYYANGNRWRGGYQQVYYVVHCTRSCVMAGAVDAKSGGGVRTRSRVVQLSEFVLDSDDSCKRLFDAF